MSFRRVLRFLGLSLSSPSNGWLLFRMLAWNYALHLLKHVLPFRVLLRIARPRNSAPRDPRQRDRVESLGAGTRIETSPADALAVARDAHPAPATGADPHEPNGLRTGSRVAVVPDDYGFDPVAGEVVASSPHEVAIRRHDPVVGEVVVHFPRVGFRVTIV